MSDYPQGPGWWQASDGRWYPPQEPPMAQPPASPYPPYSGPPPQKKSKGPLAVIVAVAAVAAAIIGFVVVTAGDDDGDVVVDDSTTTTEADDDDSTTTTAEGGGLELDVADGFVPLINEDEGFAIALPETWREFDLADPAVQDSLDDFVDDNPQLAGALSQADDLVTAGGVLLAIDPTQTPFGPNINIIKSPGEADLGLIESTVVSQLEPLGARNITTDIIDIPVGGALVIEYDITFNQPDGSTIDAHGVQFQVPAGGSTWAITMTTDDIERELDPFEEMIGSFTVAE
ncbi:MAG: hypothetical protein ACRD0A_20515 [Acidimicrobiales bacterium]